MIDTHAHLTDSRYQDVSALIENAKNAGVHKIITVGYHLQSSLENAEIANRYENVFFTAGVHPSDCETLDNGVIDRLFELLKHEKCLAVGETGLDYHYLNFSKEEQIRAFRLQLDLAVETSLPVIVHSREACKDTLDILTEYAPYLKGFLMHCYSDSKETAKILTDLGAHFSFGGVTTFKNAKKDEIIKSIPKERILLETDCPYMAPEPFRGKMNTPEYLPYIYQKVASVYGVSVNDFAQIVKANFDRLFKK